MGPNATRKNFGLPTPIILVCLAWLVILAQGCGTVQVRHPVPQVLQDEARVVGMPDVRGYGDSPDDSMRRSAVESIRQELAAQPGKPDGEDFNLAVIPEDFKVERKEEFDRNYMNQLFNLGYDQGRRGYAWMKYPPGLKQAIEAEEKGTTAGKTSLRQEGR
jgi:hypothetical protein